MDSFGGAHQLLDILAHKKMHWEECGLWSLQIWDWSSHSAPLQRWLGTSPDPLCTVHSYLSNKGHSVIIRNPEIKCPAHISTEEIIVVTVFPTKNLRSTKKENVKGKVNQWWGDTELSSWFSSVLYQVPEASDLLAFSTVPVPMPPEWESPGHITFPNFRLTYATAHLTSSLARLTEHVNT